MGSLCLIRQTNLVGKLEELKEPTPMRKKMQSKISQLEIPSGASFHPKYLNRTFRSNYFLKNVISPIWPVTTPASS